MRIRSISIKLWRHFADIQLDLDPSAGLVCIVGANGTGKSHLLELIAACAHRLGLSQGVESSRGDPFNDIHDFELHMHLAEHTSEAVDVGLAGNDDIKPFVTAWDRHLSISSSKATAEGSPITVIRAGGIADEKASKKFAAAVIRALQQTKDVHFVSLDANRAYPNKNYNVHEMAQAYEVDWDTTEYTRGRSFKATEALYDEWIKYFLAREYQAGTKLIQNIRRAREAKHDEPKFVDHFDGYKSSLRSVLPHLIFSGVEPKKRQLLFDSTGLELAFSQLSGGEREIAFLLGQIDRFQLRKGLFLLDEPELHLNADLIRSWVGYLTSTVENGQIWLATHSLEAVEAAGLQSTFVLERNEKSRKVGSVARLDSRPVRSALSRAVGTPAFSLSGLRFVFVEGEEGLGERERFRRLSGAETDLRFIECGSCEEVVRRVRAIKSLSSAVEDSLRMGGVIDCDHRGKPERDKLEAADDIHVLQVHEVENFFLEPITVQKLIEQNGRAGLVAAAVVQEHADRRAGVWIFQKALAAPNAKGLPDISPAAKDRAKRLVWADFANASAAAKAIAGVSGYSAESQAKLAGILEVAIKAYERIRVAPDLWKHCEGKEVLPGVANTIGFNGPQTMSQAALGLWDRSLVALPVELLSLRTYLARL